MALVLQDRVSVNSNGSGTGSLVLGSAYPGFRSFASCIPDGSTVYYTITNQAAGLENQWEVGTGTYTLSTNTLSRTTVLSSSNSGALVDFTAGTNGLQVFIAQPAEKAVYQEASGDVLIPNGILTVIGANATNPTFNATLGEFVSNEDSFSQLFVQNQSSDANASADIVAYNNLGDGASYFIDMGIDSSNYNSGDYPIFQENDGYLFTGGNIAGTGSATDIARLMIGTSTANSNVVIFGGSVNAGAEIATFVASNKNVGFANNISVTEYVYSNNAVITNLAYSNGNLANASNSAVLVTQAYVDSAVSNGFHVHAPVNLATTAPLSGTPTYNQPGGAGDGVGATLTAAGNGVLEVDGQNADLGFRILVQSQANAAHNGVYTVTTEGTGGAAYQLTRATDADTYVAQSDTGLGGGDYFFVEAGDTQAYFSFICTNDGAITFGSTNITFQNFAQVPIYTGTAPINVSGQTIALTGIVPTANGGTNLSSYTTGDTLYANATNSLAKLAIGAQYSVLSVSGAGVPHWSTVNLANANAVTGALGATNGGTGQTTYTLGDIVYSNATNTLAKLPGQTTTTQKFLSQTGDGVNSAAPVWDTIPAGSITGLGTMSTQNANAVTITGGTVNDVVIGGSTANAGTFTTATATSFVGSGASLTSLNGSNVSSGTVANARTTATELNTASAIVARDASGNFAAGTITANLTGTASSATSATSATTATNIAGGAAGSIPYQTGSGATSLLATGTGVLVGGTTPSYSSSPTLTGANFSAIPNAALSNSSVTFNGVAVALGGSGTITASTTAALTAGTGISYSSGTTFNGGTALTINNSGVTSAVAGTGVAVSGATGAVTFSIGQAVATSSNVQFNSLGVGTAGSGTAGEIRATNNITAYYSDERLKTKIGNIENALDKVKQIETMVYHANQTAVDLGYDASIIEVGVTAQSVQKVMPQTVAPAPINDKYLTVRYERLVPLLIEAIKELEAKVEALQHPKAGA